MIAAALGGLWAATPLLLAMAGPDLPDPIEQTIPGTAVSFRLRPVPDGEITVRGKTHTIRGLSFGETEVTWDLFDVWAFQFDLTPDQQARGVDATARPSKPYGAPDRGFGHAGYPAMGMTFFAAGEFCKWLSAKTGRRYRLPTEAEWEYAARAGRSDDPKPLEDFAWFWDNADDKTWPCGRKKANAWGLLDVLGNVAEWSQDAEGKPVACGGSFLDKASAVGLGARQYQQPKWNERDPQNPKSRWWLADGHFVGFRLVLER